MNPITHVSMAQLKVIRVKTNARALYEEDPRWVNEAEDLRITGMEVLYKIQGKDFPVVDVTRVDDNLFYHLPLSPAITIDSCGLPLSVSVAVVPYQYVDVVEHGFWEAS
jgi:hypothetical protein